MQPAAHLRQGSHRLHSRNDRTQLFSRPSAVAPALRHSSFTRQSIAAVASNIQHRHAALAWGRFCRARFVSACLDMGRGKKRGQEEAGATSAGPAKAAATAAGMAARAEPAKGAAGMQHYMCHLQVLASDVEHNSASLVLVFDRGGRYMFNAGEGLQRLMREKKIRMNKLDHYLFTRVSTETMAGLPGMLLSTSVPSSDAGGLLKGQDVCSLIGPPGMQAYVHAFKDYVNNEQTLQVVELPCAPSPPSDEVAGVGNGTAPSGGVNGSCEGPAAGQQAASGTGAGFRVSPPVVENEFMTVVPITLSPELSKDGQAGMDVDGPPAQAGSREDGQPAGLDKQLTDWQPRQDAACYVCELRGTPGKFDPKRADELDVPRGRERGDLQRGQSVTLLTGEVIQPHQVMSPGVPGPCLAVVDCPTPRHLELLAAEAGPLAKWTDEAKAELAASSSEGASAVGSPAPTRHRVMAHFTPPELVASERYQTWIQSLGPGWNHVLLFSGAGQKTTLLRASVLQAKLHCLHPSLFPSLHQPWKPHSEAATLLPAAVTPQPAAPASAAEAKPENTAGPAGAGAGVQSEAQGAAEGAGAGASGAGKVVLAPNACRYHLLPLRVQGVDSADVSQDFSEPQVCEQFRSVAGEVIQMAQEAYAGPSKDTSAEQATGTEPAGGADAPEVLRSIGRDELEVVFLGTVSSVPSKFRNVTAIYLDRFHRGGMLLDCGEDTLGQLKRRYGALDTERRVLQLRCVWVSHMHADHHGGLYRLLSLRHELAERRRQELQAQREAGGAGPSGAQADEEEEDLRPLLVIGPWALFRVLAKYREVLRLPFHFLASQSLEPDFDGRPPPPLVLRLYDRALQRLQLRAIAPFPVMHVGRAHGIRVEGEAGWKVIFSGDTRPAPALVAAAKQATLLIHEATFENDKADEALAKNHSTTGEAMRVAAEAGAYRTILTHFSTRYPTIPDLDGGHRHDVAIAMDFMSVNLLDLPWLPKMVAPLDALFKREAAGWEADEAEVPAAASLPAEKEAKGSKQNAKEAKGAKQDAKDGKGKQR